MITINNIKYIIFAFIVLGIMANFAQNEYGMDIVNWCTLLLGISFLGNLAQLGVEMWKNKIIVRMFRITLILIAVITVWFIYSPPALFGPTLLILVIILILELFFVSIANSKNHPKEGIRSFASFGLFLLFIGPFMKTMHWPGAGIITIAGGATAGISLMIFTLKSVIREFKNSKNLALIYLLLLLNVVIGVIAAVFKAQHWPGSIPIFLLEAILLFFFLLPMALNIKFKYGNEKISVARFLKTKSTVFIFLFIYFNFGAVLMAMWTFDLGPKFYTLAKPPLLTKMIDESPGGNGTEQTKNYNTNYTNFIEDYWDRQGK